MSENQYSKSRGVRGIVVGLSTIAMAWGSEGRGEAGDEGHWSNQGWRVMAGFQCRAAGWHSDEDNDVLVSHQITEQACSEQSGSGQPPHNPPLSPPPPRLHPLGHKLSKRSWLQCSHPRSGAAQRGRDRMDSSFKRSGGIDARCRGEHLLQLGGVVDACPSVSVCHFASFKVTAARHVRE